MQKSVFKFLALFFAFLCIFYFARKVIFNQGTSATADSQVQFQQSLPDDFHDFYNQFHTDSVYQLEHIIFPLKGFGKIIDEWEAQDLHWQKEGWKIHKPFDSQDGAFERVFTNVGGMVTEMISNGLFTMEKRYAKLGGEWHLIYYQELVMNE